MIRLCIWMNIPSHYQSAFFSALDALNDVDLKVVYLKSGISHARVAEGWRDSHNYQPFECSAEGVDHLENLIEKLVPDWTERIHLTSSYFTSSLIDLFCTRGIAWCHWSEMPGIQLAELLRYRMSLFRILIPIALLCKRGGVLRNQKHALGAFGQGYLARKAFRLMGIPNEKIVDLYYAPSALSSMKACNQIVEFAAGRKVFLTVGVLCQRKGTDVLLNAFAKICAAEWCLVLCGLDKSAGRYQALSEKLGLKDRVLFLGAYPSDRIAEIYAVADVFILPSRFDGWGVVLNEAASLGIPLIATEMCGAAWHVIVNSKNGFRVKVGSVIDLAEKMQTYVKYPQILKEHGRYSKELFCKEFTPERNADRLVQGILTLTGD